MIKRFPRIFSFAKFMQNCNSEEKEILKIADIYARLRSQKTGRVYIPFSYKKTQGEVPIGILLRRFMT